MSEEDDKWALFAWKAKIFVDEGLFVGNGYAATLVSKADPTYVVKESNRYQE